MSALTGAEPIETQTSLVFVGPHNVYKMKKAIRLGFLDYAALPARRAMALREVALNRAFAPEIYRGVLAIGRDAGGMLRLTDADKDGAIEHVVHMTPVPPEDFLDAIIARGELKVALQDALGDCVVDLHARLPAIRPWDSAGGLRHIVASNAAAALAAGLCAETVARWRRMVDDEIARIGATLDARAASGSVRRLHGDLHAGNICVWRGAPTAFDMLEFDEALATADVGYDLAALLMDLDVRAGRAAANRVMNRYIARTGDVGVLATLPCFFSVRAMVHAHVHASGGEAVLAARYVRCALDSLQPAPVSMVAIGGLQGTGKTTLGRALAPEIGRAPGALLLRSDELRKRLFGALPEQKLPPAAYGHAAHAKVNAALVADAATALRAGQAVIADSTFLHKPLRHGIAAAARAAHAPFRGFWLEAPLEVLLDRVAARTGDASDAGPDVLRAAAALDPGHVGWPRVAADNGAGALAQVRAALPGLGRDAMTDDG